MITCDICGEKTDYIKNIHIGLDIGFHIGNYNEKEYINYYKQKPECLAIHSIYLCNNCLYKLQQTNWTLNCVNIMPKLKEFLTDSIIRKMVTESLK